MLPERFLTRANFDGTASALTGNGEICTTLDPFGYQTPAALVSMDCEATQSFAWAGRRKKGPRHVLADFGRLSRRRKNPESSNPAEWRQSIDLDTGSVISESHVSGLLETTRSYVAAGQNVFVAETLFENRSGARRVLNFQVVYTFGEPDAKMTASPASNGFDLTFEAEHHLGAIHFRSATLDNAAETGAESARLGAKATHWLCLEPGERATVVTWLCFSDRQRYQPALDLEDLDALWRDHVASWADFWKRGHISAGGELLDDIARTGLYAIRCQATPWSIPPALCERYWGGGVFHDELYPFLALLARGHTELAERVLRFRLVTLPRAMRRGMGQGALYPWSSTEEGEERDPHGNWLTERFHLGQFAECVRAWWEHTGERESLARFYPVVRETARHYEEAVLCRDADGKLGTHPCVDFDESAGIVRNGPFTLAAAASSLSFCAGASETLGLDEESRGRWRSRARELLEALPKNGRTYAIPDGKPLHSSVVGIVFPFRMEGDDALARETAAHIHEACRSGDSWKPGLSEAFEGSKWVWACGCIAAAHARLGDGERAWEALQGTRSAAGPMLLPCEHRDAGGVVRVPWFTTGKGAWLAALASLFVQADAGETRLLPALPASLRQWRFEELQGADGNLFSGEMAEGRIIRLTVTAPKAGPLRIHIPVELAARHNLFVSSGRRDGRWLALEFEAPASTTNLLANRTG